MGAQATFTLLGITADDVGSFISVFIQVYILLILVYILSSWVRLPYNVWLARIQRFLYDVCEPYLRIFRRVIPPFGPLDLSPVVAVIVLIVIQRLITGLL